MRALPVALLVSGCAFVGPQTAPEVVEVDRAAGVVRIQTYDPAPLLRDRDWSGGVELAVAACAQWGYSGASALGIDCKSRDMRSGRCLDVTQVREYQCSD